MSITTKIVNTLKKAGYKKEKSIPEVNIYLKWYDERYAAGFNLIKRQKVELINSGFGLLDLELTKTLNKIEGTEEFGLYHLTVGKELIDRDQEMAIDFSSSQSVLDILNNQLITIEKDMPMIIEQYQNAMTKLSPTPYFATPENTHKSFGHIYYGLVYSLVENKQLTPLNIKNAIEYATKLGVNNKNFQFKINLLKRFLEE